MSDAIMRFLWFTAGFLLGCRMWGWSKCGGLL
jgi:hypothetical protein